MGVYRPGGVVVLAIIYIIMQTLGIIVVILIMNTMLPQQYVTLSLLTGNEYIMREIFSPDANEISASYAMQLFDTLFGIDQLNIGAWGILIFSGVSLPASISLLSMKKWGRYLSLIIGIILMIIGLPLIILGLDLHSFMSIIGLIPLLLGIVTVVYLMSNVKYEFE